ncbi:hypothetical protein VTK26DRAFT_8860 [Humicola hyalothermophila]
MNRQPCVTALTREHQALRPTTPLRIDYAAPPTPPLLYHHTENNSSLMLFSTCILRLTTLPARAMENAVCFKCRNVFPSYRAVELHLMSCDAPFEPQRSDPWAFIPPPAGPGPLHSPHSRRSGQLHITPGISQMGAWQNLPQILNGNSNSQNHGNSRPAHHSRKESPKSGQSLAYATSISSTSGLSVHHPLPKAWAQRSRSAKPGRGQATTGSGPATCTKCNISFPDATGLGNHFAQSPAHPHSSPAPSNSWSPPETAFTGPASPSDGRQHRGPGGRRHQQAPGKRNAASADENVRCECGKAFETASALSQHKKDSKKHAEGLKSGAKQAKHVKKQGGLRKESGGGNGNEIDDMAAAFGRLVTI